VGFLERDFERDHLAEKSNGQKRAKKYTVGGELLARKFKPHMF
jgi:hypothetical protein